MFPSVPRRGSPLFIHPSSEQKKNLLLALVFYAATKEKNRGVTLEPEGLVWQPRGDVPGQGAPRGEIPVAPTPGALPPLWAGDPRA